MSEAEHNGWAQYKYQRVIELMKENPDITESFAEKLSWFEFLQLKWVFKDNLPEGSPSNLASSLLVFEFGPDLRGIESKVHKKVLKPLLQNKQAPPSVHNKSHAKSK